MQVPPEITFRGFPHSDALEAKIRQKIAKLEQICDELIGCRVMVERTHHKHHKGDLYSVRIDITLPHKEIVVSRKHHDKHQYEDPYVAVRDAFDAAIREVEEYKRMHHGKQKKNRRAAEES